MAALNGNPSHIPSVNDWWRLVKKYPDFRAVTNCALKDYGYMSLTEMLEEDPALHRILEFGHGFSGMFLQKFQNTRELWAVDDFHDVHYLPKREGWEQKYNELTAVLPAVKFHRGLLGRGDFGLPEGFFDVVCSVSVLEEVNLSEITAISRHAARLLKPNGRFINTHDLRVGDWGRLAAYCERQREAGFDVQTVTTEIEPQKVLIESPQAAMLWYQQAEGEERVYWGHWTTVFTVATKRSSPTENTL